MIHFRNDAGTMPERCGTIGAMATHDGDACADDWVLAVDVRCSPPLMATAGVDGVGTVEQAGALAADQDARPPLAVVVVHPASWETERLDAALDDVARDVGRSGWPPPVPLTVPEAAAWQALRFGLVPAQARLAVLDPRTGEASVVDRDGDVLVAVGGPVRLERGTTDLGVDGDGHADGNVRLVGLARLALDAAAPGPPFAGVLLAGGLPGEDAELPGLVARITGRAPLVPGDVSRAAVLGAAALGWAAATASRSSGEELPVPAGVGSVPVPEDSAASGDASPASSPRQGRRPRRWAAAVLGVLVVVAIVAGLGWQRARTAPAPFTHTCPDGQVVAYSYECPALAPSASP
jgi:hypothetical protein